MPAVIPTFEQIVAAVNVRLSEGFVACAVQYPGEVLDVQNLSEWVELEVQSGSRAKERNTNKNRRNVKITVGIFVKPSTNIYRHMTLQTLLIDLLEHAVLKVRDYDNGSVQVGWLKLYEANTQVTTRSRNQLPTGTKTAAASFMAYAQEN